MVAVWPKTAKVIVVVVHRLSTSTQVDQVVSMAPLLPINQDRSLLIDMHLRPMISSTLSSGTVLCRLPSKKRHRRNFQRHHQLYSPLTDRYRPRHPTLVNHLRKLANPLQRPLHLPRSHPLGAKRNETRMQRPPRLVPTRLVRRDSMKRKKS